MPKKYLSDFICTSVQDVNKTVGNEYGIITNVNSSNKVNLKLELADENSDDLENVPTLANLGLEKGDKVLVTFVNNNPAMPVVIGKL